jgi:putative membrane protein
MIISGIAASLAVFVASKILRGVKVKKSGTLVLVAVLFGVLNAVLGWLVTALVAIALLPVALLTFGLVYLLLGVVVNAILLWVIDKLMDDFDVKNGKALFATAFLVSVAGWLLHA